MTSTFYNLYSYLSLAWMLVKKKYYHYLKEIVSGSYVDFFKFFLNLAFWMFFFIGHMITQTYSYQSRGMRTAHVMLYRMLQNDMLICMLTCKDMHIYKNEVYTYKNWMVYKTCVCVFSALWDWARSQEVVLWLVVVKPIFAPKTNT